jgi:chromate transport protein ChrA
MTAARIWKIYRRRLADERRVQWTTGLAGAALLTTVWFAPWVLVLLVFYGALAVGLLRCSLFDGLLLDDADLDDWA